MMPYELCARSPDSDHHDQTSDAADGVTRTVRPEVGDERGLLLGRNSTRQGFDQPNTATFCEPVSEEAEHYC